MLHLPAQDTALQPGCGMNSIPDDDLWLLVALSSIALPLPSAKYAL